MRKAIGFLMLVLVLCFAVMVNAEDPQKVSAGDIITFGRYEQDNIPDNGPEAIEWMVLDVQDGKALLLSKYGLETKKYNAGDYDITWERCTLRDWLNNDFLNQAFSMEEQSAIPVTEVDNSDAQGFDFTAVSEIADQTIGGNNTEDKIFLLSCAEASRYLDVKIHSEHNDINMMSLAAPTTYAFTQGAFYDQYFGHMTADGVPATRWWLRSPGGSQFRASFVYINGFLYESPVASDAITVRPALWLDMKTAADLSIDIQGNVTDTGETTKEKDREAGNVSGNRHVETGDVIPFGHYEQDNNLDNGPEPIEWIVLDVQGGKALLLSNYGLDVKPYSPDAMFITPEGVDSTWEKCSMRAWLNNDFLNNAFSMEEQIAIPNTTVDNSAAQGYSEWNTDGGNNTEDKIFLLSYTEANRYLGVKYWEDDFGNNMKSRVVPTEYARKNNALLSNTNETTRWWWLRSPGDYQGYAAIVNNYGSLDSIEAYYDTGVVRPALWLDLNAGIF